MRWFGKSFLVGFVTNFCFSIVLLLSFAYLQGQWQWLLETLDLIDLSASQGEFSSENLDSGDSELDSGASN